MLDVFFSSYEHDELAKSLHKSIRNLNLNGTLYFSYPTFRNANENEPKNADALLVSKEHGLIVFDFSAAPKNKTKTSDWVDYIESRQDDIYWNIYTLLFANKGIVHKRKFIIDPKIITFVRNLPRNISDSDIIVKSTECVSNESYLKSIFERFSPIRTEYVHALNAIIQGISSAEYSNDKVLSKRSGFGDFIFSYPGNSAATLDQDQLNAALSSPLGPQRIQGVPGSGKTTVLALKAAHLHVANPHWKIAITFRNMALASHLRYLIGRFVTGISKCEPDWSKLHVVRSWRVGRESFYSRVAEAYNLEMPSRIDRMSKGYSSQFEYIFKDGLEKLKKSSISFHEQAYDAILIDDAQELPPSFFQFAYAVAKPPKRIVWASDEFQSLIGYASLTPQKLFGKNSDGQPNVKLNNIYGQPPQDITLGISYRNTPRTLTIAHALVCGLHRKPTENGGRQIFQIYNDPIMWERIGYSNVGKYLSRGKDVKLQRPPKGDSIPFTRSAGRRFRNRDGVHFKSFVSLKDQWKWISKNIDYNIDERRLCPEDILIVFPHIRTALSGYNDISIELRKKGILSNIVRMPMSRSHIIKKDHVTITSIFAAKETEFPMVYFANAHECHGNLPSVKKRNALFTGITRSTAWVRVCGVGKEGQMLENEFKNVVDNKYQLSFKYPTTEQIQLMNRGARDADENDSQEIDKLSSIIREIYNTRLSTNVIPKSLINEIKTILKGLE